MRLGQRVVTTVWGSSSQQLEGSFWKPQPASQYGNPTVWPRLPLCVLEWMGCRPCSCPAPCRVPAGASSQESPLTWRGSVSPLQGRTPGVGGSPHPPCTRSESHAQRVPRALGAPAMARPHLGLHTCDLTTLTSPAERRWGGWWTTWRSLAATGRVVQRGREGGAPDAGPRSPE